MFQEEKNRNEKSRNQTPTKHYQDRTTGTQDYRYSLVGPAGRVHFSDFSTCADLLLSFSFSPPYLFPEVTYLYLPSAPSFVLIPARMITSNRRPGILVCISSSPLFPLLSPSPPLSFLKFFTFVIFSALLIFFMTFGTLSRRIVPSFAA